MARLKLSKSDARRIVEAGTETKTSTRQTVKKPIRGRRIEKENIGIYQAQVVDAWTQNETRNAVVSARYYDNGAPVYVSVLSPLSRSQDLLEAGTLILIAKLADGSFILLNAECPQ